MDNTSEKPALTPAKRAQFAILSSAFAISICGISYELLAGTISSYFLGNAVLQYSLTIGLFLSAMGIGSYLSRKFEKNLLESFLVIQILVGLTGGFSTFFLFMAYRFTMVFSLLFYLFLLFLGMLIGLEIPILVRILKDYEALKFSISDILAFDYIGALLASILFPLFILPHMGLMHASFFYALINMVVVFLNISVFSGILKKKKAFLTAAFAVSAILFGGLIMSGKMVSFFESRLYEDEIIVTRQTKYQRIVVTNYAGDMRLYLDGNLQFSSWDEYRYHEALVHPVMNLTANRENVLILGGGDGLAAREVFKYPEVKKLTLVDLDPEMVDLCKTNFLISRLNCGSLSEPRMNLVYQDAYKFLETSQDRYGVIIVDLPDPNNEGLSKLYTVSFYRLIRHHLAKGGAVCVQSTSPYFARRTFWCVKHTIEKAGTGSEVGKDLYVKPYHLYVPSMGDWGFCLASDRDFKPEDIRIKNISSKYIKEDVTPFFFFAKDEDEVPTEINTLNSHKLLYYYDQEWKKWE
ncbi:MAG: polyamine aminopropyltransferase [Firmicutes bacterium]|nr:polyamine aminopropyltransferase [Bacillota bacterium]